MNDDKIECMKIARKYDKDYWYEDRRYGYGCYKCDGRWEAVAKKLIEVYNFSMWKRILY